MMIFSVLTILHWLVQSTFFQVIQQCFECFELKIWVTGSNPNPLYGFAILFWVSMTTVVGAKSLRMSQLTFYQLVDKIMSLFARSYSCLSQSGCDIVQACLCIELFDVQ